MDKVIGEILKDMTPSVESLTAVQGELEPALGYLELYLSYFFILVIAGMLVMMTLDLAFMVLPFIRSLLLDSRGVLGGTSVSAPVSSSTASHQQGVPSGMSMERRPGQRPERPTSGYGASQVVGGVVDFAKPRFISDAAFSSWLDFTAGRKKNMITTYMVRNFLFIVMFMVVLVVFTNPIFFQFGLKIAEELLKFLGNLI